MPKIKIETSSNYSAQETYQRVKGLLENDPDLRRLDSGYTCNFQDSALTGTARGNKFQAQLQVQSQGDTAAHVKIDVDLPLMLSPFKSVVESTLEKKVQKALA